MLYRLARDAAEGRAREESFAVVPGLEIVAAVRPLADRQTAWWFTPRLAASTSPQPVLNRAAAAAPAAVATAPEPAMQPAAAVTENIGDLFRDAPMGMAFAEADGGITDANAALSRFFGSTGTLAGRNFAELVEAGDRARCSA